MIVKRKTNTTAVKTQSGKKSAQTLRHLRKQRKSPYNRVVEFPQTKGRVVELVKLIASDGYSCISIHFQDKTDLRVVIDPYLAFKADFSDWKTDNQRVLKRWPTVRSEGD